MACFCHAWFLVRMWCCWESSTEAKWSGLGNGMTLTSLYNMLNNWRRRRQQSISHGSGGGWGMKNKKKFTWGRKRSNMKKEKELFYSLITAISI